ncbi:hypothetical protein A2U01_0103076, partial [Trifolium medium]|nr:hypothetical protein [Trifolium medium]
DSLSLVDLYRAGGN